MLSASCEPKPSPEFRLVSWISLQSLRTLQRSGSPGFIHTDADTFENGLFVLKVFRPHVHAFREKCVISIFLLSGKTDSVVDSVEEEDSEGLSASASLVSLAWMIASYQKVLRDSRDDKLPMSYKAVIAQMLWHFFTIGARTVAFALFASVFQLYFGIFIVSHWCVMTFWIIQGETDFCMSKWEEIIYNMVVGIIYIFCWFNVKEGPSRFRMTVYYSVTLAENVALTAAWYAYRGPHTSDSYALVVVCLVACSFALGTFFMLVYYCWLHPDGPVLGSQWGGCVDEGEGGAGGVAGVIDACLTPSQGSQTPGGSDVVITSPPRTLPRTRETGEPVPGERDRDRERDRDSCLPVFQVRPSPSSSPALLHRTSSSSRAQEGPVIRIDLPRKRYPAWDAHFIDRRLRKTILLLETTSPVSPRIQYRSSMMGSKEVLEYETTV
ncbi:XK-related protein 7-like [Centroberyx gerrardi]